MYNFRNVVLVIMISLILLFLNCTKAKSKTDFWTIIPGSSVGFINKNTKENELKKIFGEINVARGKIGSAEGESIEGTIIYKDTPNQLEIVWSDNFTIPIKRIIIRNGEGKWRTSDNIRIGTKLDELIKLNNKDFLIYGFEWDHGGVIKSWDGGRLDKNYKIGKKFAAQFTYEKVPSIDNYSKVVGNKIIKSNNKILSEMGLKLKAIVIIF